MKKFEGKRELSRHRLEKIKMNYKEIDLVNERVRWWIDVNMVMISRVA
jgi:hypothetical protein